MTIYTYNSEQKKYIKQLRCKNPVAVMFDKQVAKQFATDFAKTMGLEIVEDYENPPKQQEMPFADKKNNRN